MANQDMANEIQALKDELKRLQESAEKEKTTELEEDSALDALVDGAFALEGDLESKANDLVERMKLDYNNMSPATAVAIFSAGALFGRLFLSK